MSQSIFLGILLGSCISASVNLLMRLSLDTVPKPYGMLIFYFASGLVLSLGLGPAQYQFYDSWNLLASELGALAGLLNFLVTLLTVQAFSKGPAGLTVAFQNAGSVASSYLLWIIFGKVYGFEITWITFLGSLLVVIGLILGARNKQATEKASSLAWLAYAFSALCAQGVSLSLFHWMSLLGKQDLPFHPLLIWYLPFEEQIWFVPSIFLCSLILQTALFLIQDRRALKLSEAFYGSLAGLLNTLSTFILLWASREATDHEKLLVFPCFAVLVVLLCNLWEYFIYHRPINWMANFLCCLGIFIASWYSR